MFTLTPFPASPEYNAERQRLQKILDEYMALTPLSYGAEGSDPAKGKKSKKAQKEKQD